MSDLEQKFTLWKTRLLDTSRRNRLLYLTPRRGQVRVLAPDADVVFGALVNEGRKLTFVARVGGVESGARDGGMEGWSEGEKRETGNENTNDRGEIEAEGKEAAGTAQSSLFALTDSVESVVGDVEERAARTEEWENDEGASGTVGGEIAEIEPIASQNPLLAMTGVEENDEGKSGEEAGEGEATESVSEAKTVEATKENIAAESISACTPRRNELLTGLSEGQLGTALYNLRSHARTALEEQGVNVLFLSFGILHWEEPTTHEKVMSPLLLVPVQLERSSVTQPFTLQIRDEDILLNPTLTQKLYMDFRMQLPRLPEDSDTLTVEGYLETVRTLVQHVPTWTLTPDVVLELYSFEKLVMVRDLEAHEQEIMTHPLLLALAGDPSALPPPPLDLPKAQELDEKTKPEEVYQVLDADSSQQVAIEWAKRGASFVIEGPPGTGKSQTIANIIAEALAQDKKVLFVSAKLAALEVVAKRLAQCGLANFYLEAHSHHSSRGTLVSNLGQALFETYAERAPALEKLAQLSELRGELNEFAHALHTPFEPLRQTAFHAYAELAPLTDAPDLYFDMPTMGMLDERQFQQLDETLDNLTTLGAVWEGETNHPWRGVALENYSFKARTEIEFRFGELMQGLTAREAAAEKVAELLTLPTPTSLQGIDRLDAIAEHALETPMPPSAWFRAGEAAEVRILATEAQGLYQEYAQRYAEYTAQFTDALIERTDLAALRTRFENAQDSPLRIFDSQYRQDMRGMREASRSRSALDVAQAIAGIQQAQALLVLKVRIAARHEEYVTRIGKLFNEGQTDWATVSAQLDWVERMMGLFAPEPVPDAFINLVSNRPARVNAVKPLLDELHAVGARLQPEWDFLTQLFPEAVAGLYAETLTAVRAWLAVRLERIGELEAWLRFEKECAALEGLGAGAFLESARAAKLQGDQLKPAFFKRFYPLWLDGVYASKPILEQSEELHRKRVVQFCRADVEQQTIARERLVQKLAGARPAVAWSDAPSSEVTLLKRELAKRKHHKSFRRLASEIPNLLLTLKPCLMMSPLSVSQYLASAPVTFDLVIFDEASQIPPEEAIAAIVRAKQIIVAGDHQQLPPTPFFQTLGEMEEEEWRDTNVLESLLQEAAVVLPSVRLMWHYRSRHEALLGFSNHYFYEDRLVTFPNAAVQDARLGVELIYVPDGVYDRAKTRTNPVEARRVVELVLDHFTRTPERSLGVVTFSQAQRGAIDLELQELLRTHPELETFLNGKDGDGFFCKSLENVQGDERDVMFFSVGYGKDVNGALSMNFGPLNGEDGARRLNVAVTRAREQVKLVSSILPADLDVTRTNSKGVQLLRAYMDYAARKGQAAWTVAQNEETHTNADDAELRDSIQEQLRAQGMTVQTGVGSGSERIDLALIDPEDSQRYALGIELDGEHYRNAKTARERERLRVQVLEQLGWKMYRLRAKDWLANAPLQVEHIKEQVAALDTPADAWASKAARARKSEHATNGAATNGANGSTSEAGSLVPTGMAVYVPVSLARQGTPEQFFRADEKTLRDLLLQLTEQEGPIHWNAVARRIAACWGITRVTTAVENHLDAILSDLITQGRVLLRDEFLWSPVTMDVLVRQPAPGQEPRPIEEIALEEIAKAAYLNLKNALSLTGEDWLTLTARLLGYPRASERVKRRIQTALERLEVNGIVQREDGKFELKRQVGEAQTGTNL